MKFNRLNIPTHWENYWTRYPEGHTILEALIQWVSQVDSMVDNQNSLNENVEQFRKEIDEFIGDFIGNFDKRLQDEVIHTLQDWQSSGFLDIVIDSAIETKFHEMDERLTAQMKENTDVVTELKTRHIPFMNTDGAITHALNVGGTYLGRRDIVYGNDYTPFSDLKGTVNGQFELDCSSFIQAIFTGTTFENSAYFNENNTYGTAFYPLLDPNRKRGRMLAHQIGKYCYDNGLSYIPKADWSNAQVGDLVFNSNSGEEGFWNQIGHLGIISRINQNGTITILQCIEETPSPIIETTYTTAQLNGSRRAYLCGRIPLPDVENTTKLISRDNYSGVRAVNLLNSELQLNKQYTLFIKANLSPGAYPIIRSGGSPSFNIYSFTGSVKRRPDKLYKANFFITSKEYVSFMDILFSSSSGTDTIELVALYDGYVTSLPSEVENNRIMIKQHAFSKEVTVPPNETLFQSFSTEVDKILDAKNYHYTVNVTVSGTGASTVQATLQDYSRKSVSLFNTTSTERNISVHYTITQLLKIL